jgi:hypothetical protein
MASSFHFYMEYRYERNVLDAFIHSIYQKKNLDIYNEQELALAAMEKTYLQMRQNEISAMDLKQNSFDEMFTSPLLSYALTKDGACGGNSMVLAEILKGMGFTVRPAQMKVNNKFGGHIVLEAKINGKWAVFDPMYNLAFKKQNGELASFEEIKNNWEEYKLQTPGNYNYSYRFEDVRYTNWSKIPYLGATTRFIATIIFGKTATDNFSIRAYLLNPKKNLFYCCFVLMVFSLLSIVNKKYFKVRIPRYRFRFAIGKKVATYP